MVDIPSIVTWRKEICRTVWAREEVAFINVAPTVRLAVPAGVPNETSLKAKSCALDQIFRRWRLPLLNAHKGNFASVNFGCAWR